MRKAHRALRIGNWRPISTGRLLGYERYTDRARDTVLVLANPTDAEISETVMVANSKMMDGTRMVDLIGPAGQPEVRLSATLMQVSVPARSARVFSPDVAPPGGYTNYKRVQ
jgi:hypothetical protein